MIRVAKAKWPMIAALFLCGSLCWRCAPFRQAGVVPFSYIIGRYDRDLSYPQKSGQPERWFSSDLELMQIRLLYSGIFGMQFKEGEVWKRGITFPHMEEIVGRRFELYDVQFEIQLGYYVRLFEGRWVDDPAKRKIVLISVNNGLF